MKQTQNTLPLPAVAVPALNEKVRNFLEARAIQKRNIESDKLEREVYDDNLERKSKPVVQAIKASTETQAMIPSVQMMRAQRATQQLPPPQQAAHASAQSLTHEGNTAEHSTLGAKSARASAKEPWIQKLYRKYRNSTKCKTTQFEIAEKGVLGLKGQVDVALLLNENILHIRIPGKGDIYENNPSVGLAALLLLPFDDLKRSKITSTEEDMKHYVEIMSRTGFSSINSKKYQTYIKTRLPSRTKSYRSTTQVSDSEDDVFETASGSEPQIQNMSLQEEKVGKGIHLYQNPKELEAKLMLMIGSMKAGNTSKELKRDVRMILDEMLKINYITLKQHRLLYQKTQE
jgi:hypothetical protein